MKISRLWHVFSFTRPSCHKNVIVVSQTYYFVIAGGKIVKFIHFTRILARCENQTALSRVWSLVAASIFNNGNNYTIDRETTKAFLTTISSISTKFSSIWAIDTTISDATIQGRSEPRAMALNGYSRIFGVSLSNWLASYLGHSLVAVLTLYWDAVGVLYSPSRLVQCERLNVW